jgi:parallel beta-helix repeat protein
MTEALADPRYSAETKVIIEHKRDLLPLEHEYRLSHGNVSLKSPEAVAFLNERLRASGKTWQITSENIDTVFGNMFLNSSMNSPVGTGVMINGGGGNTFDHNEISGGRAGVDLENTKNNKFNGNKITSPTNPPK